MTLEIPEQQTIEQGIYPAVLTKLELKTIEPSATRDGGTFRIWHFAVDVEGVTENVSAASSLALGPKSKALLWLTALMGRRPIPGEKLEVIGRKCRLHLIVDEETGYNKVAAVLPADNAPRTARPAPTPEEPVFEDDGLPPLG